MTRSLEASSASSESSANDESIDQLMNLDEAGLFSISFHYLSECDSEHVRHCATLSSIQGLAPAPIRLQFLLKGRICGQSSTCSFRDSSRWSQRLETRSLTLAMNILQPVNSCQNKQWHGRPRNACAAQEEEGNGPSQEVRHCLSSSLSSRHFGPLEPLRPWNSPWTASSQLTTTSSSPRMLTSIFVEFACVSQHLSCSGSLPFALRRSLQLVNGF